MFLKRVFDIVSSFIGLILIMPVLLIVSVLIRIKMSKPVLFKHERIGRFGVPFTMYKFRTMVNNHHSGSISVLGEERITKLGAWLRKYKIDELPELWNILKGDMSFVGPRPDVKEFCDRLEGEEKIVLELRPGLTGSASLKYKNEEQLLSRVEDPVAFTNEVIWPEKVKINIDYYYQRTFLKDMRIILKTLLDF
jgi:lipopolysaccharide/colanic/teichoic acid biosynthesis glycosyltransferase